MVAASTGVLRHQGLDTALTRTPQRLLLIEDNAGDARLIQALLSDTSLGNAALSIVQRLADGIALMSQHRYDVILTDLGLPDSGGLDTLRGVRAQAPDVAVVVLTGFQDEALGLEAISQGAQDFLPKGEATPALIERVIRYAFLRKAEENAILDNEARYRQLFHETERLRQFNARLLETLAEGVLVADADERIRYANRRAVRLLGQTENELQNQRWKALIPSSELPGLETRIAGAEPGTPMSLETRLSRAGKPLLPVLLSITLPVSTDAPGIVISFVDLSEQDRVTSALQSSRSHLKSLTETAPDAIITVDSSGGIVSWNRAAADIWGYSAHEAIGKSIDLLVPSELRDWHMMVRMGDSENFARSLSHVREVTGERRDGTQFSFEANISLWYDNGMPYFTVIGRDISDRKALEAAREAASAHQALLARIAGQALRGIPQAALLHRTVDLIAEAYAGACVGAALWDARLRSVSELVCATPLVTTAAEQVPDLAFRAVAALTARQHAPLVIQSWRDAGIPRPGDTTIESLVAAPLLIEEEHVGTLVVGFSQPRQFGDNDVARFEQLAGQLAMALARARLNADLRHQAARLTTLNHIATVVLEAGEELALVRNLCEALAPLFSASAVFLARYRETTRRVHIDAASGAGETLIGLNWPPEETLTGRIIAGKVPLRDNVYHDLIHGDDRVAKEVPTEMMPIAAGVMLAPRRQSLGVLWVGRHDEFTPDEIGLLRTIGAMTATALQRLQLIEETQARVDQLSTLLADDPARSASSDAEEDKHA